MQTAHVIRYLLRLATARVELLQHPIKLGGDTVMCADEKQAELIKGLLEAWTRDYEHSSNTEADTPAE